MLSLGFLGKDVDWYFGLDSGTFDSRERDYRCVCWMLDEDMAFAVFHQIADTTIKLADR